MCVPAFPCLHHIAAIWQETPLKQAFRRVLLLPAAFCLPKIPMLDIGGGGAHRDPLGSELIEIVGGRLDHGRAEEADALAPAERPFRLLIACFQLSALHKMCRRGNSLMALTCAGNELVGRPQRGEGIASGENEARHAGLRERRLERTRPAGKPNRSACAA